MNMEKYAAVIMITTAAMDRMSIITAKTAAADILMEAVDTAVTDTAMKTADTAVTDIVMMRWNSVR